MVKNIFISDDDHKVSSSCAGIAIVIALILLNSLLKPSDIYGHIVNVGIALVVAGIVYFIVELIRKKSLK